MIKSSSVAEWSERSDNSLRFDERGHGLIIAFGAADYSLPLASRSFGCKHRPLARYLETQAV